MTLYTGYVDTSGSTPTNHDYKPLQFKQLAAHEFGHSGLHLYDTYTDGHNNPDPGLATQNSRIRSIMRTPYALDPQGQSLGARPVDYDMVFQTRSWESSSYVYYSSRPDIMNSHFGAGNW